MVYVFIIYIDKYTAYSHKLINLTIYFTFTYIHPLGRYVEGVPGGDRPTEGAAGGHTEGRHHRRGREGQNYDHLISHLIIYIL